MRYTVEVKIKKSDRVFGWNSTYKLSRFKLEQIKQFFEALAKDPIDVSEDSK